MSDPAVPTTPANGTADQAAQTYRARVLMLQFAFEKQSEYKNHVPAGTYRPDKKWVSEVTRAAEMLGVHKDDVKYAREAAKGSNKPTTMSPTASPAGKNKRKATADSPPTPPKRTAKGALKAEVSDDSA